MTRNGPRLLGSLFVSSCFLTSFFAIGAHLSDERARSLMVLFPRSALLRRMSMCCFQLYADSTFDRTPMRISSDWYASFTGDLIAALPEDFDLHWRSSSTDVS